MFDMTGHERATRSATFKGNERAGESGCVWVQQVGVWSVRDHRSIDPRLVAILPDLRHEDRVARDIPAKCGLLMAG